MPETPLDRDTRLALKAKAHDLDPVVRLGAAGLTEAVLREIDRALSAHGLIKVRVPGDDREERQAWFVRIAEELSASRVAEVGKVLVFFRPLPGADEQRPARSIRPSPASGPARPKNLRRS